MNDLIQQANFRISLQLYEVVLQLAGEQTQPSVISLKKSTRKRESGVSEPDGHSRGRYLGVWTGTSSMAQDNLLKQAQQGDLSALAHLINRSLQKQGVTAFLELIEGELDVMLEAANLPNPTLGNFIHQGLLKLNVEPVYQATVYGRKKGEHFATWSQFFALKPKPQAVATSKFQKTQQMSASGQKNSSLTLTLATGDGQSQLVDLSQFMGFLGVALLLLGVFSPMVSFPVVGTLTYFRNGHTDALALIGFAIAAAICLAKQRYDWVYGPGLGALLLISITFYSIQSKLSDLKSSMDRELLGNPFRGLADAAMASVQLQWGWILLLLGAVLILSAAQLKQRNLTRQTFIAIGLTLAGVVAIGSVQFVSASIQAHETSMKAKQSEAKAYIGSITRRQQAHFLENNQFALQLDALDLTIPTKTNNYQYQITVAERDLTVATATPQISGLKSYTGAVSAVPIVVTGEMTTISAICESEGATKTPPATPTLRNDKLQCPPGSFDPSTNSTEER